MTENISRAIVIGASAGAVQALLRILPDLSDAYPYPILVTVHVPADRDNLLVPLLRDRCRIEIKEAEDKEPIRSAVVYFAPSDYHLLVEKDGTLALSSEETVNYSRPSIDVLFESAADAYGEGLTGIILTGANEDGAQGLEAISRQGGDVIVERPDDAYAATMPEAAMQACRGARTMTLAEIAEHLARLEIR